MTSSPNAESEHGARILGAMAAASLLLGLSSSVAASAQPAAVPISPEAAKPEMAPSPEERQQREQWRRSLTQIPLPKRGCFSTTYPSTQWHEATCTTTPPYPQPPRRGPRPLTVGNANGASPQVPTGFISSAIGSFDSVTGVTSESGPINNSGPSVANAYTLQLNTNFFPSTACAGSPNPNCLGWQQFIFENSGSGGRAYIQYWLIQYNKACPPGVGWKQFSFTGSTDIYCWKNNSLGAAAMPAQPITKLGQLSVTGSVSARGDSITVASGLNAYSVAGDNVVNAAAGWQIAEFNVFGDGGGGQARFNSGATVVSRTRVFYGGAAPPTCVAQGFTGETNNLSFGPAAPSASEPGPALLFTESSKGGSASNCAAATAVGDTELKLVVTGDPVQTAFSGKSGGHHFVREKTDANQQQALSTIGGQEQSDDPCYLGVFYKDFSPAANDKQKHEFLGCSSNGGQGSDGSFLAPSIPHGYFVTGVAVVLDKDRNKVKGFWIKGSPAACLAGLSSATVPAALSDTQTVTVNCSSSLSTKEDAKERPNAIGNNTDKYDSDWDRQVFCPAGTVATGVAVNIEQGFGNKQVYSGLALRCRSTKAL